jgi:hypothetical protein
VLDDPLTIIAAALPLAADLGDIIKALVPIVAFIFWLIFQVMGKAQQQAGPNPPKPAAPPRKRREDPLTAEIDEFLAEARRRRVEAQPDAARRAPGEAAIEAQRQRPRRQAKSAPPIDAVLVPDDVSGQDVAQHVKQHLDTSRFTSRASALGDRVETADDDMEAHLRQTFDHRIGRLGAAPTTAPAAAPAPAQPAPAAQQVTAAPAHDLAARLANPQNVRDIIVLNEIITRPEARWS